MYPVLDHKCLLYLTLIINKAIKVLKQISSSKNEILKMKQIIALLITHVMSVKAHVIMTNNVLDICSAFKTLVLKGQEMNTKANAVLTIVDNF